MNHFLFDVDGTLTPSRKKINPQFALWFLYFSQNNPVSLVTGSDNPKTLEQIGPEICMSVNKIYNCNGNDVWYRQDNIYTNPWKMTTELRTFLEGELKSSTYDEKTGNHIEERPGMVNFSVVGRNATQEQRAAYVAYDTKENERNTIADAFNMMFPDLSAKVGGETGIDISPRGADKSQILRDFKEDDTIHFYGDAMFDGGNDKPLADALKDFQLGFSHQVKDWKQTWEKLK
jgi:phosphomannomutase